MRTHPVARSSTEHALVSASLVVLWVTSNNNYSESTMAGDGDAREEEPPLSKFRTLVVIPVLTLIGSAIIAMSISGHYVHPSPGPRVQTHCGLVEGTYLKDIGVYSFKNIPFAVPPLAERRWKPAEPLSNKTGTCWKDRPAYKATKTAQQCAQVSMDTEQVVGNEDCLYLDIFTPTMDGSTTRKRPVLFFIHGGYLQVLNMSMEGFTPDAAMAASLDVVIVNIQYRLSAFGFLVLEIFENQAGNYGLLDQLEAMKWVQQNIQNFGGDPQRVTLYGQSSGGTCVWAHLASPMSKGLFQQAWSLSGSPVMSKSLADAAKANQFFLKKTGCKTKECLYGLSAKTVLEVVSTGWGFENSTDLPQKGVFEKALVVIDGKFLPYPPVEIWKNKLGSFSDVPTMIGTTAQEIDFGPLPGQRIKSWTWKDLARYIMTRFDTFGRNVTEMILELYPFEKDPEYVFTTLGTDIKATCGESLKARVLASAIESNVYRYVSDATFSEPVPLPVFEGVYAFHGMDLIAFIDQIDFWLKDKVKKSDSDFGRTFQRELKHFVEYGTPYSADWGKYPVQTGVIQNTKVDVISGEYHTDQCRKLLDNGFFEYGWIN